MIMESWEIRWFGKGAIPLTLQQWAEEKNLTTQPVRTDYYLMHEAGNLIGIKWREGSLQIKELLSKTGESQPLERYKKYSFPLMDHTVLEQIEFQPEWRAVTKKRDLIKWRVERNNLTNIEPGEEDDNGVELEISAVICDEKLWWTVAFEATNSRQNLELTLKKVKVPISNSTVNMGYQEWLVMNFSK